MNKKGNIITFVFKANLSEANLFFCKMDKKVLKQITEEWFEWEVK